MNALIAVISSPRGCRHAERELRKLVKAGQIRLHMVNEGRARRKLIIATLSRLGLTSEIFTSTITSVPGARASCLRRLARRAIELDVREIVIEQDDSLVDSDRQILMSALASTDIQFRHARARYEPLLWTADAIAWSWQRGHAARNQVKPLVERQFASEV
ncbi:hypothetical protein ACWEKT_38380 [Nocardia takedensis]